MDLVDNHKGWGAVPDNREIDYFGLRVRMTPKTFLSLAAHLPEDLQASRRDIEEHLKTGGKIGAPFLKIDTPAEWEEGDFQKQAKVTGHEGRNRMWAILNVFGNDPVEVHIFFGYGTRRRHITDAMISQLNQGVNGEGVKGFVPGLLFELM